VSLRAFHVLFISASVLLTLGFGLWCLPAHPAAMGGACVVALALITYEVWFLRKTRMLP